MKRIARMLRAGRTGTVTATGGYFGAAQLRANRGGTDLATFRAAVAKKYPHRKPADILRYEISGADVWAAYSSAMKAAERNGSAGQIGERIKKLVGGDRPGGFVAQTLERELGL